METGKTNICDHVDPIPHFFFLLSNRISFTNGLMTNCKIFFVLPIWSLNFVSYGKHKLSHMTPYFVTPKGKIARRSLIHGSSPNGFIKRSLSGDSIYKISLHQHKKSHCAAKTILRLPYVCNGTPYTGMTFILIHDLGRKKKKPTLHICPFSLPTGPLSGMWGQPKLQSDPPLLRRFRFHKPGGVIRWPCPHLLRSWRVPQRRYRHRLFDLHGDRYPGGN